MLKGIWDTRKCAIVLPSKGIACEILDCDEDIYLPYVSVSVSPPLYLSTANLDFRKNHGDGLGPLSYVIPSPFFFPSPRKI